MRHLVAIWLALSLALCGTPAAADELLLRAAPDGQDAAAYTAVWRDADGSADLAAATAAYRRGEFKPTRGRSTWGIDPAPRWFRLDLRRPADAADTWWLEIPHPGLDDVRLYAPDVAGPKELYAVGDHRPFAERPLEHRNFVLPIHLPADRTVTFYLRVQTADTLIVPIRIWEPERFASADDKEIALIGIYYGLILAMLVYNLFLYIRLRDRVFASYLTFSGIVLMVVAELDGHAFEYLWPDNLWLADHQHVILPAMAIFTALAFMRRLFELDRTAPGLYLAIRVLSAYAALALAVGLTASYSYGHLMLLLILPLHSIVGLLAGIHGLRRGYRPARYYLMAQLCFQGAVLLVVGNALGLWSTHILIQHAIGIGSALEVMLFSHALAERIALLRQDKEDAMRRATAAEAASAAKSSVFAAASHDLRQPLQALGLFVDALAKNRGDGAVRDIAGKMNASLRALADMTETFLVAAQLDSDVVKSEVRPVAVSTLFERLIAEFETSADAAGLKMKVWLPRADAVVATDPGLLLTLLRNLLANAIRYTPRGGVMLACRRRGAQVLLQVWDTGHGIPAEEHDQIFAAFYRGGADGKGQGLGLGLSIVDRIAKLLDCPVKLYSKVGKGSVFEVALPSA